MKKNEINNRNKKIMFYNFLFTVIIGIVIAVLSFTNIFEKLDYRIFDSLLKNRPEPAMSEKIVTIGIDDASIEAMGEWPWSRDIIADTLIRLKEVEAETAIFDIEYISPSKHGVAPSASEILSEKLVETETSVNNALMDLAEAPLSGIPIGELSNYAADAINQIVYPAFSYIHESLNSDLLRDNDEYFGEALQFFGNSFLTVNNMNLGYTPDIENNHYIETRFLFHNVKDNREYISANNKYTEIETYDGVGRGFTPALSTLINRSNGVGFTNSLIDNDGIRRRIELLYKYNNNYLGQLVFSPYIQYVNPDEIIRGKNYLVLNNANVNGLKKDIKIPLDKNGRMIINWIHSPLFESFKYQSIISIIDLDNIESNIEIVINNLRNYEITDKNFNYLSFIPEIQDLITDYNNIKVMKNKLLSQCKGYDIKGNVLEGISDEEYKVYFSLRNSFFANLGLFLNRNHLVEIGQRIDEMKEESMDVGSFYDDIKEEFDLLTNEYNVYEDNLLNIRNICKNSFCIIGNVATSTTDIGATPFQKQFQNVGIHANILNTLLSEDFIYSYKWYWSLMICFIVSAVTLLLIGTKSDKIQNIVGGIIRVVVLLIFFVIFRIFKIYFPVVGSVIFFSIIDYLAGVIYRFILSTKEKNLITKGFELYQSKELLQQIIDNPEGLGKEGINREITALFSDIKGFSTFSESINKDYIHNHPIYQKDTSLTAPSLLVNILNDYLGAMSEKIIDNKGYIDKYIGDSIVSMFNKPIENDDHAYSACRSAIMMKKAEKEFNEKNLSENRIPSALYTRIGINTGEVLVCDLGPEHKKNFTMMGDNVNLASRLEGVNKAYGTWIICSESTYNGVVDFNNGIHKDEILFRRLDRVRVVGRSTPVQLYNIVGFRNEFNSEKLEQIEIFHNALDLYLNRDFIKAGKLFIQANSICGGDPPSVIYAQLCKNNVENGVEDNWDGIRNMTSK